MEYETGLWPEEYPSSLFQPDAVLPAVYFETAGKTALQPENKLMFAVLKDAVGCFQRCVSAQRGPRREIFLDAEAWIEEEESDWPFSFANICETLNMDTQYIRQGLRRWKKAKLAERSREQKARTFRTPPPRVTTKRRGDDRLIDIVRAWSTAGRRAANCRSASL